MNIALECLFRDISGIDNNAWTFVMMKPFKDKTSLRRDWRKRLWDIHCRVMKGLHLKNPDRCERESVFFMTTAWRVVAWHMTEIDTNWILETFVDDVNGFLNKIDVDLNVTLERIIEILQL